MPMSAGAEELYERACGIVMAGPSPLDAAAGLDSLHEGLGKASDMLDDILYERLGMSCREVVEVLLDEDIHKSHQKHVPIC